MAAAVYDTILLDTHLTGNLPTNAYRILVDGNIDTLEPAVMTERALTGKLHVHRIQSNGDTLVYNGIQYVALLTREEKDNLSADLGHVVYFMPHYRDEGAGYATYRSLMFFRSMSDLKRLDPMETYWTAVITLEEATDHTDVT